MSDNANIRDKRTKQAIVEDYVDYLIKVGILSEADEDLYKNEKQNEVLELLTKKLYETEIYNGVSVSTLEAFYHFVNFVIRYNRSTGSRIWNDFIKNAFLDIERHKNTCVLASRGMGKSYFLYVLYATFKMFLYRSTKVLMISNIPQQSVENLRETKKTIDENEFLLEKKDTWKGKDLKWTERQIEYNKGMLLTLSVGTTPKGQHVNYVIADDLVTDTTVYSHQEVENYVLGQLYPCAQRLNGRMVVVGTPLDEGDIYHTLMNTEEDGTGNRLDSGEISALRFYSKAYPARKNGNPDGEILFPEIFSEDKIKEFRITQGELKFQREYLLKASNTKAIIFPKELTDGCITKDYIWEEYPQGTAYERENKRYMIGVDVATSGAASADFSAFVVIELVETQHGMKKIVRHIVNEKGAPVSSEYDKEGNIVKGAELGQVERIHDLYNRFNFARTVVEKNNVGVSIIQELEKRNVDVEQFVTDRYKKESMIRYLVSEMNNKNLMIPKTQKQEIRDMIKELNNFGVKRNKAGKERMEALSGHDDIVMALAIVNYASQNTLVNPMGICQD